MIVAIAARLTTDSAAALVAHLFHLFGPDELLVSWLSREIRGQRRISRTPENTTVQYVRHGEPVVAGWVRGAECEVEYLREADADPLFALCASMRVPPPGRLQRRTTTTGKPIPLLPEHGWLRDGRGVPMVFAGHYMARVVEGPCSSEKEIAAADPGEVHFERRTLPHGDVLIGRSFRTWDGHRYPASTSVWATRAGHCCVATIPEFFIPPTAPQVDNLAHLCDTTSSPQ